jgi:hypothetical protein
MMCTRKGCVVDTSAFPIFKISRVRDRTNLARRRHRTDAEADTFTLEFSIAIKLLQFPLTHNYTRRHPTKVCLCSPQCALQNQPFIPKEALSST